MTCQHSYQIAPSHSLSGRLMNYPYTGACSHPVFLICIFCDRIISVSCKSTKEEKCLDCSRRSKSQRIQQYTEALLPHQVRVEVTLTAPGKSSIPWDISACSHSASERCSGSIGCRVSSADSHYWNSHFSERFNDFITHLRKRFPETRIEYGNVRENQKRELLHNHSQLIFPDGLPADLHKFCAIVKKLAIYHGFGVESSVKVKKGDVARSVAYSVKYMTKGSQRAITYDFKRERYQQGGYHVFTRSRHFGRTLKAIGKERYEKYLQSLANKSDNEAVLVLARAVELLAQAVGAKAINATPNLDSTYTKSYAESP